VIVAGFLVWSACFGLHPWLEGKAVYGLVLELLKEQQLAADSKEYWEPERGEMREDVSYNDIRQLIPT